MLDIRVLQKDGIIAMLGASLQVAQHRHHALQFSLELSSPLHVEVEGELLQESVLLIAPDRPHKLESEHCLILLIEPESHLSRRLVELYLQEKSWSPLSISCKKIFEEQFISSGFSWDTVNAVLLQLDEHLCLERHIEPRIQKILSWLEELSEKGRWDEAGLDAALKQIHLSESRFLHLFVEQVGINWRRYLRWRRLLSAVNDVSKGYSLTESAHRAAFSDASHFSRVFKEMFGSSPRNILRHMKMQE